MTERTYALSPDCGEKFYNQADYCIGTGRMGLALHKEYYDQLKLVQEHIGFSHILEDTPRAGQGRVTLGSAYLDVIPTVGSRTADYLEELGYHLILCSEAERLEASYQQ